MYGFISMNFNVHVMALKSVEYDFDRNLFKFINPNTRAGNRTYFCIKKATA
jgi:hypothetical protein